MAKTHDIQTDDTYLDKLGKLLPGELTAVYFAIRSLAGDSPSLTPLLVFFAFVLCGAFYVVSPRLLNFKQPRARLIYCGSFILWAAAIDPMRIAEEMLRLSGSNADRVVFAIMASASIWSFAAPYLVEPATPGHSPAAPHAAEPPPPAPPIKL